MLRLVVDEDQKIEQIAIRRNYLTMHQYASQNILEKRKNRNSAMTYDRKMALELLLNNVIEE